MAWCRLCCFNGITSAALCRVWLCSCGICWIKHTRRKDVPRLDVEPPKTCKCWPLQSTARHMPYTIVSNHLGYFDIFVLKYLYNSSFVANGSVLSRPCVGRIAQARGSLFLQKGRSTSELLLERMTRVQAMHELNKRYP